LRHYAGLVAKEQTSVEAALSEITAITARLDAMGPGDPGRRELIARRDELRRSARDASAASRSVDTLRYELDQAHRALADLDARAEERAKSEKRSFRWINDPESEANRIDRMLEEQDAEARHQLERRISEIQHQLGANGLADD
jgi:predicted RNase H-like nuclease (RuvC/YqgF family)